MELQIGTVSAITLAKEYATPLYVYDKQIILKRIHDLKNAFPNACICYAIKANPNHSILKLIAQQGLGVDCSNRFELELEESIKYRYTHELRSYFYFQKNAKNSFTKENILPY